MSEGKFKIVSEGRFFDTRVFAPDGSDISKMIKGFKIEETATASATLTLEIAGEAFEIIRAKTTE